MFDEATIRDYEERVTDAVDRSKGVLDEAVADANALLPSFRTIRPRQQQMVSLASDGGQSRIEINPFNLFVVRVVDSNSVPIMSEVVIPGEDTRILSQEQFNPDGTARTPLGVLMRDLGVTTLSGLTPMIPDLPDTNGWVVVFRDLCEWAALYERLVYSTPTASTVYVKDGLLRTKIFRERLFIDMSEKIAAAIDRWKEERRVTVSLAGVAKHTEIAEHYRLAFALIGGLPLGYPVWAQIPLDVQRRVYTWPEYVREPDDVRPGTEDPKFNIGAMHFVRFGPGEHDRIWTVDVLHSRREVAEDVIAALTHDATDGFPIPHYPVSLQQADEFAQVAGLDRDILTDLMKEAIRRHLPAGRDYILDALQMESDIVARRYG